MHSLNQIRPCGAHQLQYRLEKYYFIPTQGFEGFYSHLAPNSLVRTAMNNRAQQGRIKSTSKDRDFKQLDLLDRRFTPPLPYSCELLTSKSHCLSTISSLAQLCQSSQSSCPRPPKRNFRHLSLRAAWWLRHPCSPCYMSRTPWPL